MYMFPPPTCPLPSDPLLLPLPKVRSCVGIYMWATPELGGGRKGGFLSFVHYYARPDRLSFHKPEKQLIVYHNVLSSLPVYMNPDRNDTSKRESTGSLPNTEEQRLPTKERAAQDGMPSIYPHPCSPSSLSPSSLSLWYLLYYCVGGQHMHKIGHLE